MKIKFLSIYIMLFFTILNAQGLKMPKAFESQFVQVIVSPAQKKITYIGKVKYSQSSLLKWQYTSPTKKEVCTDGINLIIIDHDLEQISFYTINKGFDLAAVLSSAKKQADGNYVAIYQKKSYKISLNSNGELAGIVYNDDLDNSVSIGFDNMNYKNIPFPNKEMICPLPKTYDIIRG